MVAGFERWLDACNDLVEGAETVVPSVYSGLKLRAMPHALRALEKLPRPIAKAAKARLYP